MNRMATLIQTQKMRYVPLPVQPERVAEPEPSELMQDVREFLVGWLGGLVFFGTMIA